MAEGSAKSTKEVVEPASAAQTAGRPPASSRRRASVIQFLFNYAGTALTIVKGLVFVPFYLRHFDLATYGSWLATGNLIGMLGVVEGGFGLVFSQRLAVASGAQDFRRIVVLVGSGGVVIVAFAAVIAGSMGLAPWVGEWVGAPASQRGPLALAFAFAAMGTALNLVLTNALALPYAFQRSTVPGVIRVSAQVIEIVVIAAGLHAGYGVASLGVAIAAAAVVGLGAALAYDWYLWNEFDLGGIRFDRREALDAIKATGPMWLGRAASAVLGNSESAIIAVVLGPASAGLLAITDRAFRTAQSLVNPIAGSMFFGLAHLAGEGSKERVRAVIAEIVTLSTMVSALTLPLAFALNRGFVGLWVGPDKVTSLGLNALILASSLVIVRMNLVGMILPALGEMRRNAWSVIAELGARLLVLRALLPVLGIWGAPTATVLASAATSFWFLTRVLGAELGMRPREAFALHARGARSLGAAVLVGVGVAMMPAPAGWVAFTVRGAALAAVTVAAVALTSPWLRNQIATVLRRVAQAKG